MSKEHSAKSELAARIGPIFLFVVSVMVGAALVMHLVERLEDEGIITIGKIDE